MYYPLHEADLTKFANVADGISKELKTFPACSVSSSVRKIPYKFGFLLTFPYLCTQYLSVRIIAY